MEILTDWSPAKFISSSHIFSNDLLVQFAFDIARVIFFVNYCIVSVQAYS